MRAPRADFIARFGVPDIVIANAGISVGTLGRRARRPARVLARVLETNVVGLAATLRSRSSRRCARSGAARWSASRASRASAACRARAPTRRRRPRRSPSSRACASSCAAAACAVVTICPGYIDTPMTRVNPYRMPFLLDADEARAAHRARHRARRALRGDALADGARRPRAARAAATGCTTRARARAAQAAEPPAERAARRVDALGVEHPPAVADAAHRLPRPEHHRAAVRDLGLADAARRAHRLLRPSARRRCSGIPKVGGTKDVDLDALRALAPTHVIVNVDENRRETVDAIAGFVPHVIVTHPLAPRDNLALYRLIGAIFGREHEAERALRAVRGRALPRPSAPPQASRRSACSTSSGATRG